MFKDLIQKHAPQFRSVEDIILQDNPDELLIDDLLSLWLGESNKDKNRDNLDYSSNPEALRRVLYAEIDTGALKAKEVPYSNTRFATGTTIGQVIETNYGPRLTTTTYLIHKESFIDWLMSIDEVHAELPQTLRIWIGDKPPSKRPIEKRADEIMKAIKSLDLDPMKIHRNNKPKIFRKAEEDSPNSLTWSDSTATKAYQYCLDQKLIKKMW